MSKSDDHRVSRAISADSSQRMLLVRRRYDLVDNFVGEELGYLEALNSPDGLPSERFYTFINSKVWYIYLGQVLSHLIYRLSGDQSSLRDTYATKCSLLPSRVNV
jgi:hypothetical protein